MRADTLHRPQALHRHRPRAPERLRARHLATTARFALLLVVSSVVFAAAAGRAVASEVVDLRIGAHPDYTRVVFELDRPTGYRIERDSPSPGVQELVVTLDASSVPRKVHSDKSLVGQVRIVPQGEGSVAHIELVRDGLSLKEMILANPPRIVLDVLLPESARKAAAAKPNAGATKPTATATKPKATATKPKAAAPKTVARAEAKPEPVAKAPTPPPAPPAPKAEPVVAATAPAATTVAATDTAPIGATGGAPNVPVDRPAGVPPADMAATAIGGEPSEGGMATLGADTDAMSEADESPPPSAAERMARQKLPPVTTVPGGDGASADSGMGTGTVAAVVGFVVLLAGGLVYMRRRRAGHDEVDEGEVVGGAAESEDNPFAGLTFGAPKGSRSLGDSTSAPAAAAGSDFDMSGIEDDDEKPVERVDRPLLGETSLSFADADPSAVGAGGAGSGSAAGVDSAAGGDEEVMRIMREFERRIASLETRLDEVVDARERLERQVAAQTEELRVQRAAIARTQRAVRNMNRSDEEGPTEPALRDPQ